MKFWARNGEYNWICDFSEYDGPKYGVCEVSKTYLETAFWNKYDGASPLKRPEEAPNPLSGKKINKKRRLHAFFYKFILFCNNK